MLSQINWKRVLRQSLATLLACNLFLTGCGASQGKSDRTQKISVPTASTRLPQRAGNMTEVSPPETLQALNQVLDRYQPQVKILSPKPGEVIDSNQVSVELQVKDLPIFKDTKLNLGPHVDVVLDNQSSQSIYDLSTPLVLNDLEPGTHTLRVFASRPWHESFKNEGAYAQVTFHLFTPTNQNNPSPSLPLLTYNAPSGTYGAEPILLDFYLANAPLRLGSEPSPASGNSSPGGDWRIRCTINGQSFTLDHWQPLYLSGFNPGQNWVRLELVDAQGQAIDNLFNDTVQVIDYQPKGQDTLSKLVRGDLKLAKAKALILPGFKVLDLPETPATEPTPITLETPSAEVTSEEIRSPSPGEGSTPEPSETEAVTPELSIPGVAEEPSEKPLETASNTPQKQGWGRFLSRKAKTATETSPTPAKASDLSSTIPTPTPSASEVTPVEVKVFTGTSEAGTSEAGTSESLAKTGEGNQLEETAVSIVKDDAIAIETQSKPQKPGWARFFSRKSQPTKTASPAPKVKQENPDPTPAPEANLPPNPEAVSLPTLSVPDSAMGSGSTPTPDSSSSMGGESTAQGVSQEKAPTEAVPTEVKM